MSARSGGAFAQLSGHTAVYLAGSLLAKLASLLLIPIFTPKLELAEYGILELADATLGMLLQLVGFQIDAALTRHYVLAEGDEAKRRVVGTAFLTLAGACILAAAPLIVAPAFFADLLLHDRELVTPIRLVGAILVGIVLAEIPLAVLKAERRSIAATGWQIVRLLAELCGKIVLVVGFGLGVTGVLLGQAIPGVLFLLGAAAWMVRRFGLAFDRTVFRSMLSYSAPMVIAGLCQFALHSADRFLFGAFSTLDELGNYGIGYKLGYAVTGVLLSAFLLIWYPFVFAVKDDARRRETLGRCAALVPAALLVASLPVALFAPEIVRGLADPKFHESWRIVPIVAFAYLFWGLFQVLQTPIYVAGRTRELPRFVALAALANVVANMLLLPRFGGIGAALATVFSLALLAVLARRVANRIEPFAVDWTRLARLLAPCALCAGALYGAGGDPIAASWRAALMVAAILWTLLVWIAPAERASAFAVWSRRDQGTSE